MLLIYGVPNGNRQARLYSLTANNYGYKIQQHHQLGDPNCPPGSIDFHTIGFKLGTVGYYLDTICQQDSLITVADAVEWGGETNAGGTINNFPDMAGTAGSSRSTNVFGQMQWYRQQSTGGYVWKDLVNFQPLRSDNPYSIESVNLSGIYHNLCGAYTNYAPPVSNSAIYRTVGGGYCVLPLP
jgi:hypothetical protein